MNIVEIEQLAQEKGAHRTGIIQVADMPFFAEFREACKANSCGMFGRCWMCPPHVGDIDVLIARAKTYQTAVVYQTVHSLEDSYDIEGMLEGGALHNDLAQEINTVLRAWLPKEEYLHLGAGGCRVCKECAKRNEQPCRFPEQAMASLEAYGIAVSELAKLSGMKYINGQNTVTYFGAILMK